MSIETHTTGTDPEVLADLDALMRALAQGIPPDPELVRRVEERADRAIERWEQKGIQVDVDQLLRDTRDEA